MQLGKKDGQSKMSKVIIRFGIAIVAGSIATVSLFSLTVKRSTQLLQTRQATLNPEANSPDSIIRLSTKSANPSTEALFASIPEEDVNLEVQTAPDDGTWPSKEYSMFNFKNSNTWDSEPNMGKGGTYPGLDKKCDSSKVSTQGICGPKTALKFDLPVRDAKISSFFGWRKIYGRVHYGIDFAGAKGTPILASERGTVTSWTTGSNSGSFGIYVELNHGDSFTTLYAHMSKAAVRAGDHVEKGDVIGYIGSTGATKANHLHFEIRNKGIPYNPFLGYMELPASYASDEPEPEDIFLEIPDEE